MSESATPINQCRQWVEDFIQQENICPFAARVIKAELLDYVCLDNADAEFCLTEVFVLLEKLRQSSSPETILVILPAWQEDFDHFLEFCELARLLLDEYQLASEFQFATFHPNYLFEGEPPESASHYTNRSPWPMLHILRQESLSEALEHYPNPEEIPERNIKKMLSIGKAKLARQLHRMQNQEST